MTNSKNYIFAIAIPMVTKLVRVVIYCKKLPLISVNNPSMRWSYEVIDKLNALHPHLKKTRGHQYRKGADVLRENPILKATQPFGHVITV